jgi:hypothetical protein
MTVAALPTRGIAASTSPASMNQNVPQASLGLARGRPRARVSMNCRKPQMKNVVHTRALRTPCTLTL